MKRLFALLLVLFTALSASAQMPNITGVTFVGTGAGGSFGQMNLTDFPNSAANVVIANAINRGKVVYLLSGTYNFSAPITLNSTASDLMICGAPGAILNVNHTGSTGLFNVTGERFKLQDVTCTSTLTNADQDYFNVTGDEPSFDNCRFANAGTNGSTSTPTVYLKLGDVTTGGIRAAAVRGCRFSSAKGVIFSEVNGDSTDSALLGQGALFVGNHFGTEAATPEKMYRGIHFQSAGEFVFTGNRVHGLGDGTDGINAFLLLTSNNSEGEAQHATIVGNNFELLTGDHAIRADGFRFGTITGNLFGRMGGNGSNEGTIHITDNLGTGTDGGDWQISNNDFHNASTSTGRTIFIEDTDSWLIANNTFALCNGRQIRPVTTATNGRIVGNIFKMASGVTGSLIETSGAYTGLEISDNWIPSDCTQLTAVPTGGCVLDGVALGGSAHNRLSPGVRETRVSLGSAIGADFVVTGIAAADMLLAIYNITDDTVLAVGDFAIETDDIQNNSAADLSAKVLLVRWYDA